MDRKLHEVISIILTVIVIIGLVYAALILNRPPTSTPITLYTYIISPQNTGLTTDVMNITQGGTDQVSLTLRALHSPQIEVPIENLKLTAYNSTIDYSNNWDTSSWNTSIVQQKVFNYSFTLSQLTLQPNMSNFTIITIKLADNAPTGRYALEINLGNLKFLSKPAKYDISYSEGIWLGMIVTPKATQSSAFTEKLQRASPLNPYSQLLVNKP